MFDVDVDVDSVVLVIIIITSFISNTGNVSITALNSATPITAIIIVIITTVAIIIVITIFCQEGTPIWAYAYLLALL